MIGKNMKKENLFFITIIILGLCLSGCTTKENLNPRFSKSFYKDGKFQSQFDSKAGTTLEFFSAMWSLFTDNSISKVPNKGTVPIIKLSTNDIVNLKDNSVIRLGHSTLLLKIDNRLILTDPVFSKRVSPVSFFGPKRFHESPISIEELPHIDAVVISHNHYDHLDKDAIKKLKDKVDTFYTTLGIKNILVTFGVESSKIVELDWWESKEDKNLTFVATPAQHFSGRGLFDKNRTLWSSWVIKGENTNIYFGADSGYFEGFKQIGQKYGPFDMTFLEAGAYNRLWKSIHMMPEESVQAHIDLQGKIMFPVHNGTFKLSIHDWDEPYKRVLKAAKEKNIQITHPKMGETISIVDFQKTEIWW
jgi:L-ascorbate metabolism protein UlaG (beta-lactamase superfamily)